MRKLSNNSKNEKKKFQFQNTLLVQLVERRFPKPDVVGSSPTGRGLSKAEAST